MVRLDSGNVLLKPSQRRQLLTHLRRCLKLGQRVGAFVLDISLRRCGKLLCATAKVRDARGEFALRWRAKDFASMVREMSRVLAQKVHEQVLAPSPA